ncbi:hypothetical protein MNV49_003417 [Pseudohyphozyma bogoriensis]|nr:hypothetical protein MNV49_003417 [Pseudohyphozyma bogoriensis]
MSLPPLPLELQREILLASLPPPTTYTNLEERYGLLLRFCLVNRAWCAIAQPELLRHIYLPTNNSIQLLEEFLGSESASSRGLTGAHAVSLRMGRHSDRRFADDEVKLFEDGPPVFERLVGINHLSLCCLAVETSAIVCFQELETLKLYATRFYVTFLPDEAVDTFPKLTAITAVEKRKRMFPALTSFECVGVKYGWNTWTEGAVDKWTTLLADAPTIKGIFETAPATLENLKRLGIVDPWPTKERYTPDIYHALRSLDAHPAPNLDVVRFDSLQKKGLKSVLKDMHILLSWVSGIETMFQRLVMPKYSGSSGYKHFGNPNLNRKFEAVCERKGAQLVSGKQDKWQSLESEWETFEKGW